MKYSSYRGERKERERERQRETEKELVLGCEAQTINYQACVFLALNPNHWWESEEKISFSHRELMLLIHRPSDTSYHGLKLQHADHRHFRKEAIFKGDASGKDARMSTKNWRGSSHSAICL